MLPVELEKLEALSQVDFLRSSKGFSLPCPPWREAEGGRGGGVGSVCAYSGSVSFIFHMLVGTSLSQLFTFLQVLPNGPRSSEVMHHTEEHSSVLISTRFLTKATIGPLQTYENIRAFKTCSVTGFSLFIFSSQSSSSIFYQSLWPES